VLETFIADWRSWNNFLTTGNTTLLDRQREPARIAVKQAARIALIIWFLRVDATIPEAPIRKFLDLAVTRPADRSIAFARR
jgi:hypothetical protein